MGMIICKKNSLVNLAKVTIAGCVIFLSGCTDGGIGMRGSPMWRLTADEDAIKKYALRNVKTHSTGSSSSSLSVGSATTYETIGKTIYGSDGSTHQIIGNTIFSSDGTTHQMIGNNIFSSDGTTHQTIGNTTFSSDGTTHQTIGNTTFSSDGTTCQTIGTQMFCN
ncbi:hypothetical protein OAI87_00235 [Paracoccaceae bacterium]|nr:hypothetical protein [Paracoccaceae bacterium]